jgi:hypothetical protein
LTDRAAASGALGHTPPRLAFLVGLALAVTLPAPLSGEPRSLRSVVYDYAVTSYCGLLTPEVEYGFKRELEDLTASSVLDEGDAKEQRIAGWVDADLEWGNRGLGGFRAWCETEGETAAERFLAIARTPG